MEKGHFLTFINLQTLVLGVATQRWFDILVFHVMSFIATIQ